MTEFYMDCPEKKKPKLFTKTYLEYLIRYFPFLRDLFGILVVSSYSWYKASAFRLSSRTNLATCDYSKPIISYWRIDLTRCAKGILDNQLTEYLIVSPDFGS